MHAYRWYIWSAVMILATLAFAYRNLMDLIQDGECDGCYALCQVIVSACMVMALSRCTKLFEVQW